MFGLSDGPSAVFATDEQHRRHIQGITIHTRTRLAHKSTIRYIIETHPFFFLVADHPPMWRPHPPVSRPRQEMGSGRTGRTGMGW